MYRLSKVIPELIGRVGFRQPIDADYSGIFSQPNLQTQSGRYFDDAHAVVNVKMLREVVVSEVNSKPDNFNTYIGDLKHGVIVAVLDAVFGKPASIEQVIEYELCDHPPVLVPNAGKFVGRQIRVGADVNKCVKVDSINLHFDGTATFNLYLFSSSKKAPLKTISVVAEADSQVTVNPIDWELSYSEQKNSLFYIGYFQDDLGAAKAYDDQPHRINCGKLFGSTSVEADMNGATDFYRYQPRLSCNTYGLNIGLNSFNDYTERIVRNVSAFDSAISLQMAAKVIEGVVYTLRSNLNQRISADAAQKLWTELNADSKTETVPLANGLKKQLQRELAAVRESFFPKPKPVTTCSIRSNSPLG